MFGSQPFRLTGAHSSVFIYVGTNGGFSFQNSGLGKFSYAPLGRTPTFDFPRGERPMRNEILVPPLRGGTNIFSVIGPYFRAK